MRRRVLMTAAVVVTVVAGGATVALAGPRLGVPVGPRPAVGNRAAREAIEVPSALARQADDPDDPADTNDPADTDDTAGPVLEPLVGVLEQRGNGWFVGDVELGLGARWYRDGATSPEDYDGDGTIETVGEELAGLAGREVTLQVERDDDAAVFSINGLAYRPEGGAPPWAGGPKRAGVTWPAGSAGDDPGAGPPITPPGQAKKEGGAFVPPGQAKKEGGAFTPPGQAKRQESGDKAVPPGQAKKEGGAFTPPGQAKKGSPATGDG